MPRINAKPKKKKEDNEIANKVIAIIFLIILIAGGYYLYSMFKPIPINEINIAGNWKIAGSPVVFYTFRPDGTASSYEKFTGSGDVRNQSSYTYVMVEEASEQQEGVINYTVILTNDKDGSKMEMQIQGLSRVQMNILWKGSEFSSMTRVDIF